MRLTVSVFYFFFSSRRRHTRLVSDWSSDVCSSDLDPLQRPRIAADLQAQFTKRGPKGIYITRIGNPELAQYEKHFVEEIAAMMGTTPDEAMMRLFAETNTSPNVIFFSMNEDDVQTALKQSFVSIGSDSGSPPPAARAAG